MVGRGVMNGMKNGGGGGRKRWESESKKRVGWINGWVVEGRCG